jgi:hypothetical protein
MINEIKIIIDELSLIIKELSMFCLPTQFQLFLVNIKVIERI